MADQCPRCHGQAVLGKKFGFGDSSLYERACHVCGLFEYRSTTDADFDTWYRRWSTADDDGVEEAEVDGPIAAEAPDLRPIIAAPDDDALRLAYADAMAPLRPERAEFIRLQVDRAAGERQRRARFGAPGSREAELRRLHGREWANAVAAYGRPLATAGAFRGWEFERGFVAMLRTDPGILVDPSSRLFELAPIEHVDVTPDGDVRSVLTSPVLARLRSLDLGDLRLTDDDARLLATESQLTRCEWLDLRNNTFGPGGVAALLGSAVIRAIPMVMLEFNPCDPAMQYSLDPDGTVADQWLPREGRDAEAKFGRIPWLHLPPGRRAGRYHARHATYAD